MTKSNTLNIYFKVSNGIVLDRSFQLKSEVWYETYLRTRLDNRVDLLRKSGKKVFITKGFKLSGAMT